VSLELERLVRDALGVEAASEPSEHGAYDRFLRHRRRRARRTAGTAALSVVLALALVATGFWALARRPQAPTTPAGIPTTGVITFPRQGFQLTTPPGWQVNRAETARYQRIGEPWLVLSPVDARLANQMLRITVHTDVTDARYYRDSRREPGGPSRPIPGTGLPPGQRWPEAQTFSPLSGRGSLGERGDGRWFGIGDQGSLVTYQISWPYYCAAGSPCPAAAHARVLQFDAGGRGSANQEARRVVRALVESVKPITNALTGGPFVPEEKGLFAEPWTVLGHGGSGDYAWEVRGTRGSGPGGTYWIDTSRPDGMLYDGGSFESPSLAQAHAGVSCVPSHAHPTAELVSGFASTKVVKVRVELAGQAPREVATFTHPGFPFALWVLAPLPLNTKVVAVSAFDAAGHQVTRVTQLTGEFGGRCRP
jgi:hypothetical protein